MDFTTELKVKEPLKHGKRWTSAKWIFWIKKNIQY